MVTTSKKDEGVVNNIVKYDEIGYKKDEKGKYNYQNFFDTINKTIGSNIFEEKVRIYVKSNKGSFDKAYWGIEFVLSILIYQIKMNISDVHIGAFNNIEWSIKYRKNKMLEFMTYEEIRPTLFDLIDFYFKEDGETTVIQRKNFFDTLFGPLGNLRIIYDEEQLKGKINIDGLDGDEKDIFENLSEKLIKLQLISKINEALMILYGFNNDNVNQDSNIVIGYGENKENTQEYSFRIAGKQQDIKIREYTFFSVIQRLMLTSFFTLSELGIGEYERFVRSMLLAKKLNIIGGETNSGKSTTIISLLKETYDSAGGKIKFYSIEDPIEKPVNFILQTQVKVNRQNAADTYDFENAEKFFLRGDPDGILVGEIRDKDTANTAVKFASTGHYTYGTLHIDNVLSIKPRMNGWGIDVASNISAFGFVEVTQLMTTFMVDKYNDNDDISKKIDGGVIKIKDLKDFDYEKYKLYLKFKEKEITKEEIGINEKEFRMLEFMTGRTIYIDILEYYHKKRIVLNKEGKKVLVRDENILFALHEMYKKYLKYLSTYFSNRYIDGKDVEKKAIILNFMKIVHKYVLPDKKLMDKIISMKITGEEAKNLLKEIFQIINLKESTETYEYMKKYRKEIFSFIGGRYVSSTGIQIPFLFRNFFTLFENNGFITFDVKSKGVVPIVEFFNYSDDYKCIVEGDYNYLLFKTKVFLPMFIYGLIVAQKQRMSPKKRSLDFFNVISLFSIEYEL